MGRQKRFTALSFLQNELRSPSKKLPRRGSSSNELLRSDHSEVGRSGSDVRERRNGGGKEKIDPVGDVKTDIDRLARSQIFTKSTNLKVARKVIQLTSQTPSNELQSSSSQPPSWAKNGAKFESEDEAKILKEERRTGTDTYKHFAVFYAAAILNRQCDQMARIFFQYLAIYSNEHLPNNIMVMGPSKFCQINLQKNYRISPNLVPLNFGRVKFTPSTIKMLVLV